MESYFPLFSGPICFEQEKTALEIHVFLSKGPKLSEPHCRMISSYNDGEDI